MEDCARRVKTVQFFCSLEGQGTLRQPACKLVMAVKRLGLLRPPADRARAAIRDWTITLERDESKKEQKS